GLGKRAGARRRALRRRPRERRRRGTHRARRRERSHLRGGQRDSDPVHRRSGLSRQLRGRRPAGGARRAMSLPELHLQDWRATKDTLHLYSQIVGKIRLASTPPRNHWWNVALYVDVRGLTTRRLHQGETTFEVTIHLVYHALVVRTADRRARSFELHDGLSVADFDARLHATLSELDVDVEIKEEPFGVPMTTPFPDDVMHSSWDRDAVGRFFGILDWSDAVLDE